MIIMEIEKKVIFVGPPASGKSSIVLTTFGYVEPEVILRSSIEPTRGIDVSNFQWRNLQIGVFDLAGQELETWFKRENEYIFPATDELLIIFDCRHSKRKILELVEQLNTIVSRYDIPFVYVLLHKIDLIPSDKKREKKIGTIRSAIEKKFGKDKIRVFGTSILPDFYKGFQFTLNYVLSSLQISVTSSRVQHGSELVSMKLLPDDKIDVNLEDDGLAEIPENSLKQDKEKIGFQENLDEELNPEDNERIWQD
ncbi:ADP-ribosylation factor-like protein [Candidatus Lokiarchaeum ossiferum]|uniref:ADP-ribosylation factor-like protein n=1 Tax=Candidatus Lokiarchaeum ossiferum TaxID=2951803 RepID=UPI00352CEABB